MVKKKYEACILSLPNGTVQIGQTVYQPATGAIFNVNSRCPREDAGHPRVSVPDKSMKSAKKAIREVVDKYGAW